MYTSGAAFPKDRIDSSKVCRRSPDLTKRAAATITAASSIIAAGRISALSLVRSRFKSLLFPSVCARVTIGQADSYIAPPDRVRVEKTCLHLTNIIAMAVIHC
jgi:hypothetical protein